MLTLAPLVLALTPPIPADTDHTLAAPVMLEADGAPIDTSKEIGHAGPTLHDIDGDGRAELLVGSFKGVIDVYERDDVSTSPAWKKRGRLQAAGEDFSVPNW